MNRAVLGRVLAGTAVVVALISTGIIVLVGGWDLLFGAATAHNGLLAVGLGSLGWVTIGTQTRNGAVWALIWAAFFGALFTAAGVAAGLIDEVYPTLSGELGASPSEVSLSAALAAMVVSTAWIPAFFLVLTLGLLLFPDGRPPSPRWKWVGWYSVGFMTIAVISTAWLFNPTSTVPYNASQEVGVAGTISWLSGFVGFVAVVASVAALVVRYRRSSGVTRHQIRWIAWGGTFLAASLFSVFLTESGSEAENLLANVVLSGEALLILSFLIAITKYRLYDIDVVISRTVVYGVLAVFITGVYVAVVVGLGSLIGQSDEPNLALAIGATALVAVAFQPVRRRVQHWANRLVYGERATPYEILASFSHRASEMSDAELIERIPRLIVNGTGASEATLWVRAGDRFLAKGTWPQVDEPRELTATNEEFADPEADHSFPVFHGDELLGGISFSRARGETITPAEKELLESLGSGMGLALRNARLTTRLEEQVASLEASRERVLAAADEARRALELDLDRGPQQQLVALKVRLGPTRVLAEKEGAIKTSKVVAQLEQDAGDAIRAVRDFAGGVYPPLLEAEGLAVAISHRVRSAPLPVIVDAERIGRYPREVESAVYFCVLESLQNVVKYARATSVRVRLSENEGELIFEVRDDGVGFDDSAVDTGAGLANMGDRLDAVGGVLEVESSLRKGTSVRGSVPLRQVATVGA